MQRLPLTPAPEGAVVLSVLAHLSTGYPSLRGRLPTCYSPVRHFTRGRSPFLVRLACVRHAASVRSEPGSNSPVKSSNPPLGGGLTVECDSCAHWLYGNPKPTLLINGSCYYLVFKDRRDFARKRAKYFYSDFVLDCQGRRRKKSSPNLRRAV